MSELACVDETNTPALECLRCHSFVATLYDSLCDWCLDRVVAGGEQMTDTVKDIEIRRSHGQIGRLLVERDAAIAECNRLREIVDKLVEAFHDVNDDHSLCLWRIADEMWWIADVAGRRVGRGAYESRRAAVFAIAEIAEQEAKDA